MTEHDTQYSFPQSGGQSAFIVNSFNSLLSVFCVKKVTLRGGAVAQWHQPGIAEVDQGGNSIKRRRSALESPQSNPAEGVDTRPDKRLLGDKTNICASGRVISK